MFFQWWSDRLNNNIGTYITPNSNEVRAFSKKIDASGDTHTNVINTWGTVRNNIQYKLSKKWKTPNETLSSGDGDCEDYTFLLCSLFPLVGVKEAKIHAGNLVGNKNNNEYHAWAEVNGMVVDATTTPTHAKELTYEPVTTTTLTYK